MEQKTKIEEISDDGSSSYPIEELWVSENNEVKTEQITEVTEDPEVIEVEDKVPEQCDILTQYRTLKKAAFLELLRFFDVLSFRELKNHPVYIIIK